MFTSEVRIMPKETLMIQSLGPLRDVALDIAPTTVLLGKSGAGKSLTLKVLAMMRHIAKMNIIRQAVKIAGARRTGFHLNKESYTRFVDIAHLIHGDTKIVYTLNWEENATCTVSFPSMKTTFSPKNAIGPFMKLAFLSDTRNLVASWERRGAALQSRILDAYFAETYELWEQALDNAPTGKHPLDYLGLTLEASREGGRRKVELIDSTQGTRTKFTRTASGQRASAPIAICAHWLTHGYDFQEDIRRHYLAAILNDLVRRQVSPQKAQLKLSGFPSRFLALHIEEPELGLDPETQVAFLENLVQDFDSLPSGTEASIVFTTHSPYWVTALNTLLQEAHHPFLTPQRLAGYLIQDGSARSILDPKTNLLLAQNLDEAAEKLDARSHAPWRSPAHEPQRLGDSLP